MISEIDQKLDLFFNKESQRYCDHSIWKEVFDIAISYEYAQPSLYKYEIKRLRDLKNTYDYAYKQGSNAQCLTACKRNSGIS